MAPVLLPRGDDLSRNDWKIIAITFIVCFSLVTFDRLTNGWVCGCIYVAFGQCIYLPAKRLFNHVFEKQIFRYHINVVWPRQAAERQQAAARQQAAERGEVPNPDPVYPQQRPYPRPGHVVVAGGEEIDLSELVRSPTQPSSRSVSPLSPVSPRQIPLPADHNSDEVSPVESQVPEFRTPRYA